MRIAVATKDGKNVNEHFGKAEEFHIFDLAGQGPEFIGRRKVKPLSVGDRGHDFDEMRFKEVLAKIADCSRVYVSKIGEKPAAELLNNGIMPVLSDAAIESLRI